MTQGLVEGTGYLLTISTSTIRRAETSGFPAHQREPHLPVRATATGSRPTSIIRLMFPVYWYCILQKRINSDTARDPLAFACRQAGAVLHTASTLYSAGEGPFILAETANRSGEVEQPARE